MVIGAGPNGAVSRAKVFGVAGFERQFAIKRFSPELTAAPSIAQGLSASARSYGSLEHPRIARMSEFGVAQGQTFTAVELVSGLDVFRLMQESKLAGVAIVIVFTARRRMHGHRERVRCDRGRAGARNAGVHVAGAGRRPA